MVKKRLIIGVAALLVVILVITGAVFAAGYAVYPYVKGHLPVGKKVAVLEVVGPIDSSKEVIRVIHAYRDDPTVTAVIVYIDSPGGSVTYTQEIYDELLDLKKHDKVVTAYMSAVAASGGYYIATAADEIYASPGTLTGSIGVILTVTNVRGLFSKIGIETKTIKSGAYKDIGSPMREMTPEEEALLGDLIDDVYYQFLDAVVDGRGDAVREILKRKGNKNPDRRAVKRYVMEYADGRILSGRQGKDLGFVDELGNFRKAIERTARLAGIEGEPTVVKIQVEKETFWGAVFSGSAGLFPREITEPEGITLEYSLY